MDRMYKVLMALTAVALVGAGYGTVQKYLRRNTQVNENDIPDVFKDSPPPTPKPAVKVDTPHHVPYRDVCMWFQCDWHKAFQNPPLLAGTSVVMPGWREYPPAKIFKDDIRVEYHDRTKPIWSDADKDHHVPFNQIIVKALTPTTRNIVKINVYNIDGVWDYMVKIGEDVYEHATEDMVQAAYALYLEYRPSDLQFQASAFDEVWAWYTTRESGSGWLEIAVGKEAYRAEISDTLTSHGRVRSILLRTLHTNSVRGIREVVSYQGVSVQYQEPHPDPEELLWRVVTEIDLTHALSYFRSDIPPPNEDDLDTPPIAEIQTPTPFNSKIGQYVLSKWPAVNDVTKIQYGSRVAEVTRMLSSATHVEESPLAPESELVHVYRVPHVVPSGVILVAVGAGPVKTRRWIRLEVMSKDILVTTSWGQAAYPNNGQDIQYLMNFLSIEAFLALTPNPDDYFYTSSPATFKNMVGGLNEQNASWKHGGRFAKTKPRPLPHRRGERGILVRNINTDHVDLYYVDVYPCNIMAVVTHPYKQSEKTRLVSHQEWDVIVKEWSALK